MGLTIHYRGGIDRTEKIKPLVDGGRNGVRGRNGVMSEWHELKLK